MLHLLVGYLRRTHIFFTYSFRSSFARKGDLGGIEGRDTFCIVMDTWGIKANGSIDSIDSMLLIEQVVAAYCEIWVRREANENLR